VKITYRKNLFVKNSKHRFVSFPLDSSSLQFHGKAPSIRSVIKFIYSNIYTQCKSLLIISFNSLVTTLVFREIESEKCNYIKAHTKSSSFYSYR